MHRLPTGHPHMMPRHRIITIKLLTSMSPCMMSCQVIQRLNIFQVCHRRLEAMYPLWVNVLPRCHHPHHMPRSLIIHPDQHTCQSCTRQERVMHRLHRGVMYRPRGAMYPHRVAISSAQFLHPPMGIQHLIQHCFHMYLP